MSRKLTREQILSIPARLKEVETIDAVAREFDVSWQAIYYWIKELRRRGVKIKTRAQGSQTTLGRKNIRKAIRSTLPPHQ